MAVREARRAGGGALFLRRPRHSPNTHTHLHPTPAPRLPRQARRGFSPVFVALPWVSISPLDSAIAMLLTMTIALSLVTLFASVSAHYEVLRVLAHLTAGRPGSRRISLFVAITGLLAVHMCEIALFAGAFYLGVEVMDLGSFVNAHTMAPMDYFYYAAETYSSLGYGDIYPLGEIRLFASITPVIGLLLMGWSSAFLFSLVQPHDLPPHGKRDVSASS